MNKKYQLILCWRHACANCTDALISLESLKKEEHEIDYLTLNNLQYPEFMIYNKISAYPTWILRENEVEIKRSVNNPSLENLKYWLKDYLK